MYSIVVPVYNEADNVQELHRRLVTVMSQIEGSYEIIFVNDGSTDTTAEILRTLTPLTVVHLRRNFGQTAAMDVGIKHATGEYVITLDADLQNPPEEIPKLIAAMRAQKVDVVSGWRRNRQDTAGKRFVSRGANVLRTLFINDGIHDSGCTLKLYRRICFDQFDLHGEIHRFIPGMLRWQGFTVGEIAVAHEPRKNGSSKYNWKRILKGFIDMIGVWFWRKYSSRPLHLFGGGGIILSFIGVGLLGGLAIARLFYDYPLSTSVWPLIGLLFVLMGVQLIISGLLAEVLIKNYYSGHRQPYSIRAVDRQ